jgi:hypothetical protein
MLLGINDCPRDRGLILNAKEDSRAPTQIWYISYPDGEVRRVTNDLTNYGNANVQSALRTDLSLTADSAALVTTQSDQISNLWVVANGKTSSTRQVTSGQAGMMERMVSPGRRMGGSYMHRGRAGIPTSG